LRYAVEQTIQGQSDRLKEYTFGVEVFDRDQSYDPRLDTIVRVEAARLRSKLKEYYTNEGRSDPILIDLCKGSYIPVFQKREPIAIEATPAQPSPQLRRDWKIITRDWKITVMVAALLIAMNLL